MTMADVDPFVIERFRLAILSRNMEVVFDPKSGLPWWIFEAKGFMFMICEDGRYMWEEQAAP